ncbi:MAG: hypothetical protein EBR82_11295 [Caulobacteraceae bacterium]|nr:hypothetical protein [Caulobacteraceae bacterium]
MNLNAMAAGLARAVNPPSEAILWVGTGLYNVSPDGVRTPRWAAQYPVTVDVQQFTSKDLRQLDGLNVQGVTNTAYVNGALDAVSRVRRKGGDMITVQATGENYLVVTVLEQWAGWCKVAMTLQLEPPNAP